jgi:hypothetical protein
MLRKIVSIITIILLSYVRNRRVKKNSKTLQTVPYSD